MINRFRHIGAATLVILIAILVSAKSHAQSLIRDTEIEETLREIADPIFSAAGLDPESVKIYIINDKTLNAFVAGGQNLFINTGLLTRSDNTAQIAGVIAHETGHIAGGHLSRLNDAAGSAGSKALIGAILGAAAALAGAPQVGTAIFAGGATVAQSDLLKFSRIQEQSADQAAVTYLAANELPPKGLAEFFEILSSNNLRINAEGSEYLRTHPLTRDRIMFVEQQDAQSPYRGNDYSPEMEQRHARMVAKLDGFLGEPNSVLRHYTGDSMPDRYAQAAALYRIPETDRAVALIDGMIEEDPDDPYLHELKGQVLFESGRIADSVEPYREAVSGRPGSALIRIGYGRALMESGGQEQLQEAAATLREAARLEPLNAGAWKFLGIAEGRLGNEGQSALALTESAILTRNRRDAELYVRRAEKSVTQDDPDWIRLQDLRRSIAEL